MAWLGTNRVLQWWDAFFFFNGCTPGLWGFPGQAGTEFDPQLWYSCGNARSFIHCAGLGIEPAPPQ